MFLTSETCCSSILRKQPSTMKHPSRSRRIQISKNWALVSGFWSTLTVTWSLPAVFASATCHLSNLSGRQWHESMTTAIAVNRGSSFSTASISQFHGIPTISHVHFAIHFALYHFAFGIIRTPITRHGHKWRSRNRHPQPYEEGNLGGPCLWFGQDSSVSVFCLFFLCVIWFLFMMWFYSNYLFFYTT